MNNLKLTGIALAVVCLVCIFVAASRTSTVPVVEPEKKDPERESGDQEA